MAYIQDMRTHGEAGDLLQARSDELTADYEQNRERWRVWLRLSPNLALAERDEQIERSVRELIARGGVVYLPETED